MAKRFNGSNAREPSFLHPHFHPHIHLFFEDNCPFVQKLENQKTSGVRRMWACPPENFEKKLAHATEGSAEFKTFSFVIHHQNSENLLANINLLSYWEWFKRVLCSTSIFASFVSYCRSGIASVADVLCGLLWEGREPHKTSATEAILGSGNGLA